MTDRITSTGNARIKAAAALRRKKNRVETGRYLVEGPRVVAELLGAGLVDEVFGEPEALALLAGELRGAGVRPTSVTPDVLARIADSVTPQGVVAVARQRPATLDAVIGTGHLVVLCGVSDPGNAGAIIRTATASGAAGAVLTAGSVDPWNPKAVRASAGAIGRLPVVTDVDIDGVMDACHHAGQRVVALDAGGATSVFDADVLRAPVAILAGNEAHGLPDDVLAQADRVVAIPRFGPVESLNLAAAVAVAVYAAACVGASHAVGPDVGGTGADR